jgi:hypothetical protein
MTGAILSGPHATVGFGALILKRMSDEERALKSSGSSLQTGSYPATQ